MVGSRKASQLQYPYPHSQRYSVPLAFRKPQQSTGEEASSSSLPGIHCCLYCFDIIFTYAIIGKKSSACCSYARPQLDKEPDSVEMVSLEIGDEQKVKAYYESALAAFQHNNCLHIAKSYAKLMDPRNEINHSHDEDEKGPPTEATPGWWPENLICRELNYQMESECIRLLIHIFRDLGDTHGITTDKLEEAGRGVRRHIKPRKRLVILDEIYKVRRAEECYKKGEIVTYYTHLFNLSSEATIIPKIVNRHNAGGMIIVVEVVVDQFKLEKCEGGMNRRILASQRISHLRYDDPAITSIPYYHHSNHDISFSLLWTAKKICTSHQLMHSFLQYVDARSSRSPLHKTRFKLIFSFFN
ncbi:uncharacterized protein ARB_02511 [Trichophyton benhamiae CBS 112371]|uniref:Subtelomeric hrmA-associated cluster protein AFUB-079030/YDR124W-like helical bundle domain-containing protein n=2 Tax=Trichophyton TaxID=5550 RepID=D4B228_ARTBC|nr:uncharacterized protein ARB_02511 [Trichophyton benhamiae CBS 112371]XP_003018633.1 uncharacterized protein TRV_07321 [Trichophyton verrucosum HKI 0517]EFE30589.1 hypothetical protein ARB_02511 [Trichophyton benhamiae CBS 112371]EFE37988.1 hypothetical protein TRV_07321 [Trichophyton verrucosum HKI 0517]